LEHVIHPQIQEENHCHTGKITIFCLNDFVVNLKNNLGIDNFYHYNIVFFFLNFCIFLCISEFLSYAFIFSRFLRHVPVVYVDYPGQTSLEQIYGTFNRAMLRLVPSLKPYAQPLTNAMVELYLMSQVSGYC
jgi:hypothetical protein